ncbi:flavin-dependent oxidoreductase [Telluribacter humicola]|uniref:flavin-dependent oxidoreductase n=1 Tax=Telluribacter humicola TaxID=1720261 RepID=UPI001A960CB1|nr:flavin-dependent oxidoreductase [Telluribacter humicola]
MKAIIIGGGIGGLTTALCLNEAGIDVQVYESVQELRPLGVGINLLPHSVRVLTNLRLEEKIASMAVETSDLVYFNKFGQKFWQEPRGRHAGYQWPQFSIHRGGFQMLLLEAVKERLGEDAVRTNHHLESFEETPEGIRATFVDRETGQVLGTDVGDLLVGCDGIHSVVRKQLYTQEGSPCFSGNVLYRGTTRMPPFLNGTSMVMVGSMKQKMVAYPISPDLDANGHQLINWVANLKEPDTQLMTVRDWNRPADQDWLVQKYQQWTFDWLDVPAMIAGAGAVYEFPMSDRDPLGRWTFGRTTLLGDAAHPMYPIGSNGASQAILDAEVLADCLQSAPDIPAALQNYEQKRLPATSQVVQGNRQKGPDQILDIMEERAPNGFTDPYEVFPYAEMDTIMSRYKVIAGFDKESLNQKH